MKETPSEPVQNRCQAEIGLSADCPNPALPGKQFCSFHENLVGPWAKTRGAMKKIRELHLKRK